MNFIKSLHKVINAKFEEIIKIKIKESLYDLSTKNPHFYIIKLERLIKIQKHIMIVGAKKISADVAILIFFILLLRH